MQDNTKKRVQEDKETSSDKNLILGDESLGVVVDITLDWPGYLKPPFEQGDFAERFRGIKWELLNQSGQPETTRGLLVTSTCANEGKSAVVYNLALMLSLEREWQSVMIDTSDESDSITNKLHMGDALGLTDYLLGNATIEQVVYKSSQPKCSLVPIGKHENMRSELLASKKMKTFVQELKEYLDNAYMIFDSKQMIDYADCKVLTPLVDQIVFVVQSEVTPKTMVQEMISNLPQDKLAGVIYSQEKWST